jgi:glycosyltransferase involved in cell wall biosynthesis
MTKPWLSVLIPTYNGSKYLSTALHSISIQDALDDIECIIIDDGSIDGTISVLKSYQKKLPLRVFELQHHGNWVKNTNYALSLARGTHACFLHQDDIWFANRLKIMRGLINQFPEVSFFLNSTMFIDGAGRALGQWKCPIPASPKVINSDEVVEKLLIQNFISVPSAIFKKDLALSVGGLDEALWYTADWDLWLKISSQSQILYYPQPLSGFRIHGTSQTVTRSLNLESLRDQLEIVKEKHLTLWSAPDHTKKRVERIAKFSIETNIFLAGMFHKKGNKFINLLQHFLSLGPVNAYRYMNNSRILERIYARVLAKVGGSNGKN